MPQYLHGIITTLCATSLTTSRLLSLDREPPHTQPKQKGTMLNNTLFNSGYQESFSPIPVSASVDPGEPHAPSRKLD